MLCSLRITTMCITVARLTFGEILSTEESIVTSNYVLVESYALIQHRLGMNALRSFTEMSCRMMEGLPAATKLNCPLEPRQKATARRQ
jgi:hypothetical protein